MPSGSHLAYWDSDKSRALVNARGMEFQNHWGAVDEKAELPEEVLSQFFGLRASYYKPQVRHRAVHACTDPMVLKCSLACMQSIGAPKPKALVPAPSPRKPDDDVEPVEKVTPVTRIGAPRPRSEPPALQPPPLPIPVAKVVPSLHHKEASVTQPAPASATSAAAATTQQMAARVAPELSNMAPNPPGKQLEVPHAHILQPKY